MKNPVNSISIRGKLFLGFGLIVLITILSGAREFTLLKKFDQKREQASDAGEITNILNQSKLIIASEKSTVENIIKANSVSDIENAKNTHNNNESNLKRILDKILSETSSENSRFSYAKNNRMINDTILSVENIYVLDMIKAYEKIIHSSEEILDTAFYLKNIVINPSTQVDTNLAANERKALLQKTRYEIKSRSKFISAKCDFLTSKIKFAIEESLTIELIIQKETSELYNEEAGTNTLIIILTVIVLIIVVFAISRSILKPINTIENQLLLLRKGILPDNLAVGAKDEIGRIVELVNEHVERLKKTAKFSTEIGKGNFDSDYKALSKEDVLGNSLISMQGSLRSAIEEENKRKIEDSHRSRTSEGLALFAEILRRHTENIKELSNEIISNLVKFLNANQGGLFILNDNNPEDIYYDLLGAYAYNRTKYLDKHIRQGEGLVGAVAVEKYTVYMTDVPNEYIEIESGIGSSNPKSILIVPLKIENNVLGVIELASFNNFAKYEIELVEKIAESIAATLSTARINTKTAELLEQSKITTSKMHQQEEEMLLTIKELKITQEENKHRENKLKDAFKELENAHKKLADKEEKQEVSIKELHAEVNNLQKVIKEKEAYNINILESNRSAVVLFNEFFEIEFFNNPAQKLWKYKETEILGKSIAKLFPENVVKQYSDDKLNAYDIFESGLLTIGQEKEILTKDGEEVSVIFSLSESDFTGKKKYTAFIRDISEEKAKDKEMNEKVEQAIGKEIEYEIRNELLEKLLALKEIAIPENTSANELIKWTDDYSIDLRVIDQQHKKWIEIVNKLYVAFKETQPIAEINRIYTEFADYTDYHFSFEEKYMIDFKYEGFKKHKRQHMKLLMDITKYKNQIKAGESVVNYSMMKTLRNWVKEHITVEDVKYVELFKEKGLS